MTNFEFNKLDYSTKQVLITKHGVLLTCLKEGSYTVILYQIDTFYVEAWYSKPGTIKRFRSFTSTDELTPFIKEIDLGSLLS